MDIFQRIEKKREVMSESQQRIAALISERPMHVMNLSARELAREIAMSPATIVRFASSLDYESYPKMLQALREYLIASPQIPLKKIHDTFQQSDDRPIESLLANVVSQTTHALQLLSTTIDNAAFCRVAHFLAGARNVFVTGARSSMSMADYLGYMLGTLHKNVYHFPAGADDRFEQLEDMEGTDALICISFQRYYKTTVDLARFGRKKGAFVVGITDKRTSPIVRHCDEVLLTPMDTPFVTYSTTLTLLDALVYAFIQLKGDSAKTFLNRRTEVLMQENMYADI